MGRFYQTNEPKYVEDFLYTPPYELIGKVLDKKNTETLAPIIQNLHLEEFLNNLKPEEGILVDELKKSEFLNNIRKNIEFYSDEFKNVKNIDEAENLRQKINLESFKIKKDFDNVTRDLIERKNYFDILRNQVSSFKDAQHGQKWIEHIKELINKNELENYKDFERPLDMDWDNFHKSFYDIVNTLKPDSYSTSNYSTGMFIVTKTGEKMYLPQKDVENVALSHIKHQKDALFQRELLGEETGLFKRDENGKLIKEFIDDEQLKNSSTYKRLLNSVKAVPYSNEKTQYNVQENAYSLAAYQKSLEKEEQPGIDVSPKLYIPTNVSNIEDIYKNMSYNLSFITPEVRNKILNIIKNTKLKDGTNYFGTIKRNLELSGDKDIINLLNNEKISKRINEAITNSLERSKYFKTYEAVAPGLTKELTEAMNAGILHKFNDGGFSDRTFTIVVKKDDTSSENKHTLKYYKVTGNQLLQGIKQSFKEKGSTENILPFFSKQPQQQSSNSKAPLPQMSEPIQSSNKDLFLSPNIFYQLAQNHKGEITYKVAVPLDTSLTGFQIGNNVNIGKNDFAAVEFYLKPDEFNFHKVQVSNKQKKKKN